MPMLKAAKAGDRQHLVVVGNSGFPARS